MHGLGGLSKHQACCSGLCCTTSESEQVTLSCQHHRDACGEMWFIALEVMKFGPKGEKGDGGGAGGVSSAAGSWGFVREFQHCKIKIVKLPTAGDIAQQSMVWSPVPSCLKAAEKQAPKMDWGRKKKAIRSGVRSRFRGQSVS